MQSSKPVPPFVAAMVTKFGWRHVKGVALIRVLVAIWLVALGAFFWVNGQWWGAFLFLAAAVNGSLAYLMPRWRLARNAEMATESRR